jgi:hypothetical protein
MGSTGLNSQEVSHVKVPKRVCGSNLLSNHTYHTKQSRNFSFFLSKANEFFEKFSSYQVHYHAIDLKQLKLITNKDQLAKSEFKDTIG